MKIWKEGIRGKSTASALPDQSLYRQPESGNLGMCTQGIHPRAKRPPKVTLSYNGAVVEFNLAISFFRGFSSAAIALQSL